MSSDLTREEQSEFTDKVGKPKEPIYMNPKTGQEYVITGKVPDTLVKKGGRKTKKSKAKKYKKRLSLKFRKIR